MCVCVCFFFACNIEKKGVGLGDTSDAKNSDFVLILGFLNSKNASLAYVNVTYLIAAVYSHSANIFVRIFFINLRISRQRCWQHSLGHTQLQLSLTDYGSGSPRRWANMCDTPWASTMIAGTPLHSNMNRVFNR